MDNTLTSLDLAASAAALTQVLVDIPSVSGSETRIADDVEAVLRTAPQLTVQRDGNAIVARTHLGRPERVILAGHLDTVPIAGNLPAKRDGDRLSGCGSADMKSGLGVMLAIAGQLPEPNRDLTFVFYDCEEVESERNGLGRLLESHPDWVAGDMGILLEGTNGEIEAGCQGTLRVLVTILGKRAHSARAWLGDNSIHRAGQVLTRLAAYEPRIVEIDGLEFREGLNAVRIEGGVAGNVIPDRCTLTINYRFAPDRSPEEALAHVQDLLDPYECVVTDLVGGAMPGLGNPGIKAFADVVGGTPSAKYGWTDVARLAAHGIPSVNFGPGNPELAHTREEWVDINKINRCFKVLSSFLALDAPEGAMAQ